MFNKEVWVVSATGSTWLGGLEVATRGWMQAVSDAGSRVVFWHPQRTEQVRGRYTAPDYAEIKQLDSQNGKLGMFLSPRAIDGFIEAMHRSNPDRIIINGVALSLMPLLMQICREGGAEKVINIFHCDPTLASRGSRYKDLIALVGKKLLRNRLVAAAARQGADTVAVSKFIAKRIKEEGIDASAKVLYPPGHIDLECDKGHIKKLVVMG